MKQRTKTEEYIIQAFIEELNHKPYEEINVTSITKLAGVTRTSFYLYFDSVDHLAKFLCHDYFLDNLLSYMKDDPTQFDSEVFKQNMYKQYRYIGQNKNAILGLWSIKESDFNPYLEMQDGIGELLYKGLMENSRDPKNEPYIEFFSRTTASSIMTCIRILLENNAENLDFVVENAYVSMHEGGLAVLKNKR